MSERRNGKYKNVLITTPEHIDGVLACLNDKRQGPRRGLRKINLYHLPTKEGEEAKRRFTKGTEHYPSVDSTKLLISKDGEVSRGQIKGLDWLVQPDRDDGKEVYLLIAERPVADAYARHLSRLNGQEVGYDKGRPLYFDSRKMTVEPLKRAG
jgi:hypothetical protein